MAGDKRVFEQRGRWLAGFVITVAVVVGFASCLASRREPLDPNHVCLAGSSAGSEILAVLARAYEARSPGQEIEISSRCGSSGAVRAILSGQTVLGRVARPLTVSEREAGLVYIPFARDMVVFCADARVNITGLTAEQLADVFSGRVEDWYEVGGYKVPVHVLAREPGDPELEMLREKLPGFGDLEFSNRSKIVFGDGEMLRMLDKYRPTIGWLARSSLIGYVGTKSPIAVDGVEPTPENARRGRYPLMIELGLVRGPEALEGAAQGFVDFVLSPEGRAILEEHGLLPVEAGAG